MVKSRLSRLMGERKLRIADVARATGVHRNLVTLLYYDRAKRLDFESLERLCRFFDCTIGEFLEIASPLKAGKMKTGRSSRRDA
jgi:putative transcriptional regulator